ncbi:MAG: hypothetical protein AAFU38_10200 [Bacteroidota bacterium]
MILDFIAQPYGFLAPGLGALVVALLAWRHRNHTETGRLRPRRLLLLGTAGLLLIGTVLSTVQIIAAIEGTQANAESLAYGVRFLFGTVVATIASFTLVNKWVPRPPGPLFRTERSQVVAIVAANIAFLAGGLALWYWTRATWLLDALVLGMAGGLAGGLHVITDELGKKAKD